MIQAKIINRINFPKVEMQGELEEIAQSIIVPDIVRGIHAGKAIIGGSLPSNEPATIKRKGGSRPLIDTGELVSSIYHKKQGKYKMVITIRSGRLAIGGYLQNDGVGKKRKKYLFFGISKDANKRAINFMKDKIKELIRGRR
jgi:hypothetical protein